MYTLITLRSASLQLNNKTNKMYAHIIEVEDGHIISY